jgi:aryl-alcohol dehydrogenase-like predicted oxidoreductase
MERRNLGRSGLQVSTLVLGGNVFGWTADEATSFRLLDTFVDAGGNFIDTADIYSRWVPGHTGGESEVILGRWFAKSGKRDKIVLATKAGKDMGDGKTGLKPAYLRQAAEDSLKRLQTDYIDLYQSHEDDTKTPLAETLGAYGQLMQAGKVRAMGASNYSGDRLAESLLVSQEHNLPRYESLQPQYSLVERTEYETTLEPIAQQEQIGVIPYFSLAGGFLTGKYRALEDVKGKARAGIVSKYLNPAGFRVLQALDEIAAAYNSKPSQVALAWLIARPSISAPIASATNLEQLQDLVAATHLKLDSAAIEKLNQVSETQIAASR